MVMKHGDQYDSFYEHMTYPERLYRTACTGPDCVNNGKLLAPTEDRIKVRAMNTCTEIFLIEIQAILTYFACTLSRFSI